MKHMIQDVECPACTTLAGPCATTEPSKVAWPVFVLRGPQSMAKLVRVARALKVLHGDGLIHEEIEGVHVWLTRGYGCACPSCVDHLDRLLEGPHNAGH